MMLQNQPLLTLLLTDILLGVVWHYATFFLCVFMKKSTFSPDRRMYRPRKWERGGRFYNDVLKINRWKDHLPRHIGKDGFSKEHLDDVSPEYLDEFILETCRGEWNHRANCLFTAVLFLINPVPLAAVLTILLLLGNLPFAFIQRYNRFRLQKLKQMLTRKARRTHEHHKTDGSPTAPEADPCRRS